MFGSAASGKPSFPICSSASSATSRPLPWLAPIAEMSRAFGRPISFVDETLEEARASRAAFGAPDWEVEAWISSYVAIARGELREVSGDVERLTGLRPKGLREWLAEAAAAGASEAAAAGSEARERG